MHNNELISLYETALQAYSDRNKKKLPADTYKRFAVTEDIIDRHVRGLFSLLSTDPRLDGEIPKRRRKCK